ncbi:MAG: NUDIX domain-containing protein [Promethearchaeota archaeon]
MPDIRRVVTNFLRYHGKILLLQRSQKVGTYQGVWAGCSGSIEDNEDPDERAVIEIEEETRLSKDQITLIRKGAPIKVIDEGRGITFIIHPYLWDIKTNQIQLDWEHINYKWIAPSEIKNFKTVPKLREVYDQVKDI